MTLMVHKHINQQALYMGGETDRRTKTSSNFPLRVFPKLYTDLMGLVGCEAHLQKVVFSLELFESSSASI